MFIAALELENTHMLNSRLMYSLNRILCNNENEKYSYIKQYE